FFSIAAEMLMTIAGPENSFCAEPEVAPGLGACQTLTVLRSSASFSAQKFLQLVPANTPPVIRGLWPRNCLSLLRLVTKARSDRLLGENECEQAAVDRNYAKRRASRNKPVNEQRAVKLSVPVRSVSQAVFHPLG